MKTYISRLMTITSVAVALVFIISAYSFASDYRDNSARKIRMGPPIAFSPNQGEKFEFLFRTGQLDRKESSVGDSITFTYKVTNTGALDDDGGICTQTFNAKIPTLPGLNSLIHEIDITRNGGIFTITVTVIDDDLVYYLNPCFSNAKTTARTAVEIGFKPGTYRQGIYYTPVFSIIGGDGQTAVTSSFRYEFRDIIETPIP